MNLSRVGIHWVVGNHKELSLMRLRGIRCRMHGWKLDRYVERCRYRTFMKKRKLHRKVKNVGSNFWHRPFQLLPGDEVFAMIVQERYAVIRVGDQSVICPHGSLILNLPEVLDFEHNYEDSARTIAIFRRALESGIRISYVSFEKLKHVTPACVMAFASYADIWKSKAPQIHARCETWAPEVELAFAQTGFFDMLGIRHRDSPIKNLSGRRYMPLRSCNIITAEGRNVGAETKRLRKDIETFMGRSLKGVRMYDSVSEAILNVRNHAYKGMVRGRLPFRWWISVSYDEMNSELGIIIFDHGYGIPRTMNTSTKFDRIRRLMSLREGGWSEKSRLCIAFERYRRKNGTSRPFVEGRGHGCEDIARLIQKEGANQVRKGCRLSVISGMARYDLENTVISGRGEAKALKLKLQGTLIEWKIKL